MTSVAGDAIMRTASRQFLRLNRRGGCPVALVGDRGKGSESLDGRNLNDEIVNAGFRWWFRSKHQKTYRSKGRTRKLGRQGADWVDRNRIPSWAWQATSPSQQRLMH